MEGMWYGGHHGRLLMAGGALFHLHTDKAWLIRRLLKLLPETGTIPPETDSLRNNRFKNIGENHGNCSQIETEIYKC